MLALGTVCAGLAASLVNQYANDVSAQIGPLQEVVVARQDVARGTLVTPAVARTVLEQRRVPVRFAPRRSLGSPREALGYRTLVPLTAGDYVGQAQLGAPRRRARARDEPRSGRLVEVAVTGTRTIAAALRPGVLVDVLVTTDAAGGSPRTYLALQRLQLVDFRESSGAGGRSADATATVRVTLRQAVTLIAAQNFAREVRVVPRPRGDVRRVGPTAVGASALGR